MSVKSAKWRSRVRTSGRVSTLRRRGDYKIIGSRNGGHTMKLKRKAKCLAKIRLRKLIEKTAKKDIREELN